MKRHDKELKHIDFVINRIQQITPAIERQKNKGATYCDFYYVKEDFPDDLIEHYRGKGYRVFKFIGKRGIMVRFSWEEV